MKKQDVIRLYQGKAKERGIELTQSDVNTLFDVIDDVILEVFAQDEKCNIGNAIKVEVKEHKERSGVTSLVEGEEGKEWTSPACKKIKISVVKSFADKHKVLI